ncbi:MAG: response regulator [Candidatus Thiodiazotropha endolucinida]|nr:response regulator [Candidatus Thiodiazotropha sp. (ex Lucina pensylvanica)]MCG8024197.1 response regulator [Candidatus Thiodiazotropha endolucinida]
MSKPAVILLVEDSRMDVELTLDAFKEARLSNRIEVSYSGQEALDYLFGNEHFADRNRHPLPDLILLDLKMPGVDGFQVLQRIKGTPLIKRIPVVILTSSKEEGDRALSYDIGANSYLVKPVAFTGFVDVVRQIEDYWLTLNIGAPMTADDSA